MNCFDRENKELKERVTVSSVTRSREIMKALLLVDDRKFELRQVEKPKCGPGEVLLQSK